MANLAQFRADTMASLGVFLVAIPLSTGISVACGASPAQGLIAAIVGGVVVGSLSGTPLMVSGPAAGLIALTLEMKRDYGLAALASIVVLCGILQVLFGILRVGRFFKLVPRILLEGLLAAVGLIMLVSQAHVMFGRNLGSSPLEQLFELPLSLWGEFSVRDGIRVQPEFLISIATILIFVYWKRIFPRLKNLPAIFPAIAIPSVLAMMWQVPRIEVAPIVSTASSHAQALLDFNWFLSLSGFFMPASALALVASAESMLAARAVGFLAKAEPALDRELTAQGVGNFFSGILAGFPLGAVIVRSAANIEFGARTRLALVMQGIWIGVFVVFFPFILEEIPQASIAAVLVVLGWNLFSPAKLVDLLHNSKADALVWVLTVAGIFLFDVMTGLGIGLLCFGLLNLHHIGELPQAFRNIMK